MTKTLTIAVTSMLLTAQGAMAEGGIATFSNGKFTITPIVPATEVMARYQIDVKDPVGNDFYTDFLTSTSSQASFEVPVSMMDMQGQYTYKISETNADGLVEQSQLTVSNAGNYGAVVEYFGFENNFKKVDNSYTGSISASAKLTEANGKTPVILIAVYKTDANGNAMLVDVFDSETVDGVVSADVQNLNYSAENDATYFAKIMLWDIGSISPITWAFELN